MTDEDRLAIHPGTFLRDLCSPRLILGTVLVWYPRAPHVVCVSEYTQQARGHFSVFLVGPTLAPKDAPLVRAVVAPEAHAASRQFINRLLYVLG
jgi:hypothetical protein